MNKIYIDESEILEFSKNHFQNYKHFKQNKINLYYRILSNVIINFKSISKTFFVDIEKFDIEINHLSTTYQEILSLRYGENDDVCYTFEAIGQMLFLSCARTSEIHRATIKILRKNIDNYCYDLRSLNTGIVKKATSLSELKLSPRAHNLLIRSKIYSIDDLLKYSSADLMLIYGIGKTTYNEIIKELEDYIKNKA